MSFVADNGFTYARAISITEVEEARAFLLAFYAAPPLDGNLQTAACSVIDNGVTQMLRPLEDPRNDIRWITAKDGERIVMALPVLLHPRWIPEAHVHLFAGAYAPEVDDEQGYIATMIALMKLIPWPGCENNNIVTIHADHRFPEARDAFLGPENVTNEAFDLGPGITYDGPQIIKTVAHVTTDLIQQWRST